MNTSPTHVLNCCTFHSFSSRYIFAWVVDDSKCIVVTRVCVSVCQSAAACPHYCTDPDVTWGSGRGCPTCCALLGGFVIGARVALLWQHNVNPSYKLASIPRYDDIVRMLGECARCWSWLASDGGVLKIARRIWEVSVAGWPVTGRRRGAFSTSLRRPGLRASTGGVLAT